METKNTTMAGMLLLGAIIALPALAAAPPKPKVSIHQAEIAATKKIPGKVVSSKYEHEDGRWQYAVVVAAKKGGMYEVEVSSTTAKVLDTEKTSAAEETSEAAADKKAGNAAPEKGEKPD